MFRARQRSHNSVRVRLYSKPGCHLCEDARAVLERLQMKYPVVIDEIDIRSDASLFRAYDIRIPVLEFEDGSILEAPVRDDAVDRVVRTLARAR